MPNNIGEPTCDEVFAKVEAQFNRALGIYPHADELYKQHTILRQQNYALFSRFSGQSRGAINLTPFTFSKEDIRDRHH